MSYLRFVLLLSVFCGASAMADIWKWVDAEGETHFVDTRTAIFTWLDEDGKLHYSDTPDHEDAIAVQLVWHSPGTLDDLESAGSGGSDEEQFADESPEDRAAREETEAYYCKRATEDYNAYKGAPRLYRTNDEGEREYLSEADAASTLEDSKAQMEQFCR